MSLIQIQIVVGMSSWNKNGKPEIGSIEVRAEGVDQGWNMTMLMPTMGIGRGDTRGATMATEEIGLVMASPQTWRSQHGSQEGTELGRAAAAEGTAMT